MDEWEDEALAMQMRATGQWKTKDKAGRVRGKGNMKFNKDGDLSMIAPLTKHARQRAKERNISLGHAVTKYGKTTSEGKSAVISTVHKNNTRQQDSSKHLPPDPLPPGHVIQTLQAPTCYAGHIIGRKGKNILQLRSAYAVDITVVAGESSANKTVYVWGPIPGVDKAIKELQSIVVREEEADSKRVQRSAPTPTDLETWESVESINVPTSVAGLVFGKGKGKIQSIAVKNKVKWEINVGGKNPKVVFWGKSVDVASAVESLRDRIDSQLKHAQKMANKSKNKVNGGAGPKVHRQNEGGRAIEKKKQSNDKKANRRLKEASKGVGV